VGTTARSASKQSGKSPLLVNGKPELSQQLAAYRDDLLPRLADEHDRRIAQSH